MSSSVAAWMLTCCTLVRMGSIGSPLTLATATEWWRSLTRRNRILSFMPPMFSSMKSESRESKTVLK